MSSYLNNLTFRCCKIVYFTDLFYKSESILFVCFGGFPLTVSVTHSYRVCVLGIDWALLEGSLLQSKLND